MTTDSAGQGPVELRVRPLAGPNMRRMVRAARLLEELGHGGDTLAALEELKRLRAELQYARDGLTKGRSRMREDNERLAREAHTWSKAAETYAAELERHKPLMQAVEWILEDGHMNQEHLARLRAAWEGA